MTGIVGWDIGGVNVKAAWLSLEQIRVTSHPFEIWHDKDLLPDVLQSAFADVAPDVPPRAMAVTMSAELSDVFATKREGVQFILECVRTCFPNVECYALNVMGDFVPLAEAQTRPLEFAAANWAASARWLARGNPNCLLVDVGSTTTDILPILNGEVRVSGRTDTERLLSGELVYTGVLRTNLAAIVQSVPIAGRPCRVASEYFAVSGDVHLILGHLQQEDYSCTSPDNRTPTVDSARKRLARLVCADIEMLTVSEIDELAGYIHEQQVLQLCAGLEQVIARLPELRDYSVIVHGIGEFLGKEAASRLGLKILNVENELSQAESAVMPCLCAAHLLAVQMNGEA